MQEVRTDSAPPPGGAYSQAVSFNGFLFVSGQTPRRGRTRALVEGSFEEQARATFANLEAIARAGGSSLVGALQVSVYLRDLSNFAVMDAVFAELFTEPRPARTTVQSNIPVEIEVDAVFAV